jgi:hypothetical protein
LRSGYSQDLPFAPLVWRYLAGEKLTEEDVFEVDGVLKDKLNELEVFVETTWTVEDWEGIVGTLPGHIPGVLVKENEMDQYRFECVQFRIGILKPTLKIIRAGFRENLGFQNHKFLSGALLARMVQGSSLITPAHLKALTMYHDFTVRDEFIQRYWRAVERFTPEQLKLLLKFVTTLTRLPNPSMNPDFRLSIDAMSADAPDQVLPTASTCFNRLHLPRFTDDEVCYQKLLYAVQFCQTMENK